MVPQMIRQQTSAHCFAEVEKIPAYRKTGEPPLGQCHGIGHGM